MKRLLTSYCYEMKKLLIARKGLAALILIVLLQIGIAFFARPIQNYYFDKELYESYTERYGGSYSNETQRLIYAHLQAVKMLAEKSELTDSTVAQEIEESSDRLFLLSMKSAVLEELHLKYSLLASCKEMKPVLTYDLDLHEYIRKFGMNWASLIGLLFLIPMLMLGDAQCGMEQILFPSAIGRNTIIASKLLAAVTISISLTAVCSLLQWIIMGIHWNFGLMNIPIQSISGFESCKMRMSVRSAILLLGVMRVLAAPALSLMICILSVLIRKEPAIITVTAILIGVCMVFVSKFPDFSVFFLTSSISGIGAIKLYSTPDIFFQTVFLLIKTGLYGCIAYTIATKKH